MIAAVGVETIEPCIPPGPRPRSRKVHRVSTDAVLLMAYGSPDRLDQVEAYYTDIRPIESSARDDPVDPVAVARDEHLEVGVEAVAPLGRLMDQRLAGVEQQPEVTCSIGQPDWREGRLAGGHPGDREASPGSLLPGRRLSVRDRRVSCGGTSQTAKPAVTRKRASAAS